MSSWTEGQVKGIDWSALKPIDLPTPDTQTNHAPPFSYSFRFDASLSMNERNDMVLFPPSITKFTIPVGESHPATGSYYLSDDAFYIVIEGNGNPHCLLVFH